MFQKITFKITGVSPLICHSDRLSNPLDDLTIQIKSYTSKRKKTESDIEEIARLEWLGGLYLRDGKPCIPGENIEATFTSGAKISKDGKTAKAALYCADSPFILYEGSKEPLELWKDENFRLIKSVRVQAARVMRCRPIFKVWALEPFTVSYNEDMLNRQRVIDIMRTAGEICGTGDWRPKFGRFTVEVL